MQQEDVADQRESVHYTVVVLGCESNHQGSKQKYKTTLQLEETLQHALRLCGFSGNQTIKGECEKRVNYEYNDGEDLQGQIVRLEGKHESED